MRELGISIIDRNQNIQKQTRPDKQPRKKFWIAAQKPNGKKQFVKRVNTRWNKDKEKIKGPEHKNPEDNREKDLKETKMTRERSDKFCTARPVLDEGNKSNRMDSLCQLEPDLN